jgi:predicted small lipoprotein YifL
MRALLAGAALAALLLGGCGQKGPLYLPDQTGEVVTRPTQTPPQEPPPAEQPPPKDKDSDEEKPQG